MKDEDFEILAEWTIRKLRDIDTMDREKILRWVLYSLGVKDLGIDIYIYLQKKRRATTTEIAEKFNISPTTARRYLEQLHALGLVDYIGREYHLTRDDLSGCIREILIPRIKRVLGDIAEMAEKIEEKEEERGVGREIVIIHPGRKFKETLDHARKEALKSIDKLVREGVEITPETISKIMNKIFDALEKTFEALGESMEEIGKSLEKFGRKADRFFTYKIVIPPLKPPRPPRPPHPPEEYVKGMSITETRDKIWYKIYSEHRLTVDDFEYARKVGKKMVIRVYGALTIDKDVGEEYADVVDVIKVYGYLEAPKRFIDAIRDRLVVYGHVEYI